MNNSSVVSTQKVVSSVGEYLWKSPCLKPLIFNPFLVSVLILSIVWLVDFWYGKTFEKGSGGMVYVQHILTTFVLVACGVMMNNILVKHYYRTEKNKKNTSEPLPSEELTAQYTLS